MLLTVKHKQLAMLVVMLILASCTSQQSQWKVQLGQKLDQAQSAIHNLQLNLNQGSIRNALLLRTYADIVKKHNPNVGDVVDILVLDANWGGPMTKNLEERYIQASRAASTAIKEGEVSVTRLLSELDAIIDASSPVLYGLMLSDPINVIADMSNGTLGRIESMSEQASLKANNEKDYGSGKQLIGNPNYGSWQQNSSGQSFWAWYGMYSLFSRLAGPVYYGDWAANRSYSYYSDHGRDYYTSPEQRRNQNMAKSTTEKKFKQQGKTFNSPYAKKRTGGATTASVTKRAASSSRTSNRRGSRPSFSSSQRSSNYKMSRSFGGGK